MRLSLLTRGRPVKLIAKLFFKKFLQKVVIFDRFKIDTSSSTDEKSLKNSEKNGAHFAFNAHTLNTAKRTF